MGTMRVGLLFLVLVQFYCILWALWTLPETGTQCLLVEQQRLLLAPYSLVQMILSLHLFFQAL